MHINEFNQVQNSLLKAREERALIQRDIILRSGKPLVCMSIVSPGPIKDSVRHRTALLLALNQLELSLAEKKMPIKERYARISAAGPEVFLSILGEPSHIKHICIEIESRLSWGRLLDLDVYILEEKMQGTEVIPIIRPLHREELGYPPRSCIVCGEPAFQCITERKHTLSELLIASDKLLKTIPITPLFPQWLENDMQTKREMLYAF